MATLVSDSKYFTTSHDIMIYIKIFDIPAAIININYYILDSLETDFFRSLTVYM